MTPTQLSLRYLRSVLYVPTVVERWAGGVRHDLFGFGDLVAIADFQTGSLAVQTTTSSHAQDRIKKALAIPELRLWLKAGNGFEVHGWAKRGERGKRKFWRVHIFSLNLEWTSISKDILVEDTGWH
jgi:hypothetical protein